jgi:hypothetical protein
MAKASAQPHFRSPGAKRRIAQHIYHEAFAGAPAALLVMTPEFQIIDANDAYLAATMRQRDSLAGFDMFEAFPDNPELHKASGVANLTRSLLAARTSAIRRCRSQRRMAIALLAAGELARAGRRRKRPCAGAPRGGRDVRCPRHAGETLARRSHQAGGGGLQ